MEIVTLSNLNPLSKLHAKMAMSMDFAITITLKPSQYRDTWEKQRHNTAGALLKIFKDSKMTLICELTKTDNIHYHGIWSCPMHLCNDAKKYFFDRLRLFSRIGKCECLPVNNWYNWCIYLNKDIALHRQRGLNPIVKDDYEIIDTEQT